MKQAAEKAGGAVLALSVAADCAVLTKPGLTSLSVATAVGAAALASGHFADVRILATLVGTWLVGGGAGTLNQVTERQYDSLMRRTSGRPLPAGRLGVGIAAAQGIFLSTTGLVFLWLTTGALPATLGAVTLLTYLMLYTPLKRLTPFAYVVGGIPGALPPVIGWSAVTGEAGLEAWALFALLYFWQIPHFLSLGWLYRTDYRRAGYPVLGANDATGRVTSRQMVMYTALLLPAVALCLFVGIGGPLFVSGGTAVALGYFTLAVRFCITRTNERARTVFLGSLAVLPLLFLFLILDRLL